MSDVRCQTIERWALDVGRLEVTLQMSDGKRSACPTMAFDKADPCCPVVPLSRCPVVPLSCCPGGPVVPALGLFGNKRRFWPAALPAVL